MTENRRCGTITDQPGIIPADTPGTVFDELLEEIRHSITNAPRSLQTRIGPSGIGEPCPRALIHQLNGDPEPGDGKIPWKAWVGTCIHAELERIFGGSIMHGSRFLLESRVTVGDIAGAPLTGNCDLFDTQAGIVWDWKTKGKTTLTEHRLHGPGEKYRIQAHCYGTGMVNAGHTVRHVGNIYLPRDGEYRDIIYWAEPYDPGIPAAAIARAEGLLALVDAYGVDGALGMYPECDDRWCPWCSTLALPLNKPARRLSTGRVA